ncbi:MAG: LCP family protein [Actinomycetota bacterium]|nr:LCP family protein [Actinomycetota bacterium]
MKRRVLAILTAVLVPVLLGLGLASAVSLRGLDAVIGEALFEIHRVDEASFPPPPDRPFFVLVVGTDARPGEPVGRGDALHLIGVNADARKASILNIPRDSWVSVPGRGTDKINAAHLMGGPRLQARAVANLVGVEIPFVVTTGFEGFTGMVDELGGVDVDVPFSMADANSGAFFEAGLNHLDGSGALAFSRNRGIPGGDLRRTEHQGLLIIAGLAKLRAEEPDVVKTLQWLAVLLRYGRVDGAGLGDLYRLGRLALSIDAEDVHAVTVPGTLGRAANQSVVFLDPAADALFADFRDDAILQSH